MRARSNEVLRAADIGNDDARIDYPAIRSKIKVYNSATAMYRSPHDPSVVHRGLIRASKSWWKKGPRYDCVYVVTDEDAPGMRGMQVARVRLLFSFTHEGSSYPCAFVNWYDKAGDAPDPDTWMWIVQNGLREDGRPNQQVIHLDAILRGAHLLGVSGQTFLPWQITAENALDGFKQFYVNKYIDSHAHEVAF